MNNENMNWGLGRDDFDRLRTIEEAWLLQFVGRKQAISHTLWPPDVQPEGIDVHWLRGHRMRDKAALFAESEAALQFPWYSGFNWNAFVDSLRELLWCTPLSGSIALVVFDADLVLADEGADEFLFWLRALRHFRNEISQPHELTTTSVRPAIPFHVILQVEEASAETLSQRLAAAGVSGGVVPGRWPSESER